MDDHANDLSSLDNGSPPGPADDQAASTSPTPGIATTLPSTPPAEGPGEDKAVRGSKDQGAPTRDEKQAARALPQRAARTRATFGQGLRTRPMTSASTKQHARRREGVLRKLSRGTAPLTSFGAVVRPRDVEKQPTGHRPPPGGAGTPPFGAATSIESVSRPGAPSRPADVALSRNVAARVDVDEATPRLMGVAAETQRGAPEDVVELVSASLAGDSAELPPSRATPMRLRAPRSGSWSKADADAMEIPEVRGRHVRRSPYCSCVIFDGWRGVCSICEWDAKYPGPS
jgi:hypothetical protein